MKKHLFLPLFLLVSIILFLPSCDRQANEIGLGQEYRGNVVSTSLLLSMNAQEVEALIADLDPVFAAAFDFNHGVDVHKIVYRTVDPFGNETIGSGALAIPNDATGALPMASYQHGTVTKKNKVPSALSDEVNVGIVLATDGYIMAMPDYLGLGESPGLHPYIHASTEASATVDMLRASRDFSRLQGLEWNNQLFLFGYSQGGHAAMAAHQALQEQHADEFTVTACVPMSGPYDVSGVMVDLMLSDQPFNAPYYLPYILLPFNEIYNIEPSLSDVFIAPLDEQLPEYFDGTKGSGAINSILPDIPIQMIKPELVQEFSTNMDHPLWTALRDNDSHNWAPNSPVRLYCCEGDELVPYENTIVATERLNNNGANPPVEMSNFGNFSHGGCVPFCFIAAKDWFDELRQ